MFTLNYSGSVGFDLTQERRIAFNEHHTGEGAIIFKHAWRTPAVARKAEEKWGRSR